MHQNNESNKGGDHRALIGSIIVILVLAIGGWFLLASREGNQEQNGLIDQKANSDELEIIEQEATDLQIEGELEAGLTELEQTP